MTLNKYSTDLLDYPVSFAKWLATSLDSDTISAIEWIVPTGLVITDQSFTTTLATVWLTGGVAGKAYPVVCRVTTAHGRSKDFVFTLQILAD